MKCHNKDMCFETVEACASCKLYRKGETYRLSNLIPQGHCYEMLHTLIPYIVSFEHGGWFKWEKDKDTVIVCCPHVDNNACVRIRKMTEGEIINFEYEIIGVKGDCPFYKAGETYRIDRTGFSGLCWKLFNILFPYLKTSLAGKCVTCGEGTEKNIFKILKAE